MCDAYAKKHTNIRVLHKPNGGLTSAWKVGLGLAIGEYTGSVDSDDWIRSGYV
ncbi:MAG: glycosyltransferase [Eubacteriales bacterium]